MPEVSLPLSLVCLQMSIGCQSRRTMKTKTFMSGLGVEEHPHIWVISICRAQYVEAHSPVFQQKIHLVQQIQTQMFHNVQTNRPVVSCSGHTKYVQPN